MNSCKDIQKIDQYKAQKVRLQKNLLLDPKIQPYMVEGFSQYRQFLNNVINFGIHNSNYHDVLSHKVQIVMKILQKEHKEKSLIYIVKKCAFLHTFLHTGCKIGILHQEITQLIVSQINQLIHTDIAKLSQTQKPQPKQKNSLQKIYNYIRGNSEMKNQEKSKSKLKMETNNQKGAIKQLSSKVLIPFCSYILKISQELLIYSKILRKKISSDQEQQIKWKIMNYLSLLSQIVYELNRLGKYYIQDIVGCWVLINYLISTDVYIYAEIVSSSLGKTAQQWHQKIILIQKFAKISKNHRGELKNLTQDQHFGELVKQIQLFTQYKQKFFYLYLNSIIKPYLSYFQTPQAFKKQSKQAELFEFILVLASQGDSKLLNKKSNKNQDGNDFKRNEIGEVIRKRINTQPNQISSPNSTISSTTRQIKKPNQKNFQQKIDIFPQKNFEIPINPRANNFISAVKSRAMGK